MSKTLFFFDTETSGLDPKRHTILQIAWLIEKCGVLLVERCFDVKPEYDDDLNLSALEVNNFTLERMQKGKDRQYVLEVMRKDMKEALAGTESLIPVGHNVRFDIDFLYALAMGRLETLWLNFGVSSMLALRKPLCTLQLCHLLDYRGDLQLQDYKLKTLCDHFRIPLVTAHDALADVKATREIFHRIVT